MHGGVGHIGMPLLADTNHAIAKAYNVLKEDEGVAFRHSIYILGQWAFCFAELVGTSVWASWAELEQHVLYTWFLLRPFRKELNVLKLKSS